MTNQRSEIKSNNSYGSIAITIISSVLFVGLGFHFTVKAIDNGFVLFSLFPVACITVMLVLNCSLFYWDTNKIVIDKKRRTITFKNMLSKKVYNYSYDDLQTYECTQIWGGGRAPHRVLYLVKNNRVEKRISSAFINNYQEIFTELNKLQQIKFKNNNFIFYLKRLFGKPNIIK